MKFGSKVILNIGISCVICTVAAVGISTRHIHQEGEENLISKSQAILSRLEAIRGYIAHDITDAETIKTITEKYPDGKLPEDVKKSILRKVPIYGSIVVGFENSSKDNYTFRVFAANPRKKENAPTATEAEILKVFQTDPKKDELVVKDSNQLTVYRPVRLSEAQGCLTCHGHPSTSPWKNGKDILGYQMENWQDGELHGVFAVTSSLDEITAAAKSSSISILLWSLLITSLILVVSYLFLRSPLRHLITAIGTLNKAGEDVSQAGLEIQRSSTNLSEAAVKAAASIEETSASTEEVSSMVKMNSDHTSKASDLANVAREKVRVGAQEVDKLTVSMEEISGSSKRIEEIISVIDDIAFQTNLLALNASVEAARAGEQGRGFAVVADAVRALAQRSATSAKEISLLIKESVNRIENGHELVRSSSESLQEIVETIDDLTTLNGEISTASREQEQGIMQINRALNEMDKITQANAAAAEESAASAEELNQQAKVMDNAVKQLNSIIRG